MKVLPFLCLLKKLKLVLLSSTSVEKFEVLIRSFNWLYHRLRLLRSLKYSFDIATEYTVFNLHVFINCCIVGGFYICVVS